MEKYREYNVGAQEAFCNCYMRRMYSEKGTKLREKHTIVLAAEDGALL